MESLQMKNLEARRLPQCNLWKLLRKGVEAIALTTLLLLTARAAQTKTPPLASVNQLNWQRIGTVHYNNGNMIEFAENLTTIKPSK